MLSKEFISLYSAIIGVLIGWILTQFSAWYRGRKEDNKIRKQVLFNLLEINLLLEKMSILSVKKLELFTTKLLKAIPGIEDSPANKEECKKVFSVVYKPLIKQFFNDHLREINQSYQSSINSLAPVDPLIAYYLNGKTDVFQRIENLISQLPAQIATSGMSLDDINSLTHSLSEVLHDKVYGDSVKDIKELTVELSEKIGYRTKKKVKKLLSKAVVLEEDDKEMDELLNKYLTGIQQKTL